MNLDPDLLEILVCPACHAALAVDDAATSSSAPACGLAYPVRDDIPVLLVDEARRPAWAATAMASSSTTPGSTTSTRSPAPTRAARRWRRPGRGSGARPAAAAEAVAEAVAARPTASGRARSSPAGPDSRLLRAVLEPWCPVPFVAWPGPCLPGWAGPLDLVIVLAPDGGDTGAASAVAEAVRAGCRWSWPARRDSLVGRARRGPPHARAAGRRAGDQLATAVVMLECLYRLGLGPDTDAEAVAPALDDVAIACSPYRDLAVEPGQDARHRAGRRDAAGLGRFGAGRPRGPAGGRVDAPGERSRRARRRRRAPAAGARGHPAAGRVRRPVRRRRRRPTAPGAGHARRRHRRAPVREQRGRLVDAAQEHDVRVETVGRARRPTTSPATRPCSATGTYAAAYLEVGPVR